MKIQIEPGKYVVAVSGGVDSVVLLDLLLRQKALHLVVAHFDHGIREYSSEDRLFVQKLSSQRNLTFYYEEGKLGDRASEETARKKRYDFLRRIKVKHQAKAILTAHHQDDVLETMVLNIFRGTGRKGLSSLKNTSDIIRPLLEHPKKEIVRYAQDNKLAWKEDATNTDVSYTRNYVRLHVMPKLTYQQRSQLLEINANMLKVNLGIDHEIAKLLQNYDGTINRGWFVGFPFSVACELAAEVIRIEGQEVSRDLVKRMVLAIKTLSVGKQFIVNKNLKIISEQGQLAVVRK